MNPTANQPSLCPWCWAEVPHEARVCWLCQADLAAQPASPSPPAPRYERPPQGDNPLFVFLGLAGLFVAIGTALASPGVLVLVLILATPALIRVLRARGAAPGERGSFLVELLGSLGVIVLIGMATVTSFFITCAAYCFGSEWVRSASNRPGAASLDDLFLPAMMVSVAVSLLVCYAITRKLWKRR